MGVIDLSTALRVMQTGTYNVAKYNTLLNNCVLLVKNMRSGRHSLITSAKKKEKKKKSRKTILKSEDG